MHMIFLGVFIGIIFPDKSIKIILLNNVQTVLRQMNHPQEDGYALSPAVSKKKSTTLYENHHKKTTKANY